MYASYLDQNINYTISFNDGVYGVYADGAGGTYNTYTYNYHSPDLIDSGNWIGSGASYYVNENSTLYTHQVQITVVSDGSYQVYAEQWIAS